MSTEFDSTSNVYRFDHNNSSSSPSAAVRLSSSNAPSIKRFHLSCSHQDYAQLITLAKSSGMSLSSYLIEMGLSSSSVYDPKIRLLLESIFYELSFIGSNLSRLIKLSTKSLEGIKVDPIVSFLHFSSKYLVDLLSSNSFKDLLDTLSGLSFPEAPFSPNNAFYAPGSSSDLNSVKSISSTLQKSVDDDLSEIHKSSSANDNVEVALWLLAKLCCTTSVTPNSNIVRFIPRNVHSSFCPHFYFFDSYPLNNTYPLTKRQGEPFRSTSFISSSIAFPFFYVVAPSNHTNNFNQLVSYTRRYITNTNISDPHNRNFASLFFSSLNSIDFNKSNKADTSNNTLLLHRIINNQLSPKEAKEFSAYISSWPKDSHHQQDLPLNLLPSGALITSPDATTLVSKSTIAAGSNGITVDPTFDPATSSELKPKSDSDT